MSSDKEIIEPQITHLENYPLGGTTQLDQLPHMSASESNCPGLAAALRLLLEAGEALDRPLLVGIGGPGGSGKSSFAAALARELGDARILPLDDYRKPRHERGRGIFGSHPGGNRLDLLHAHLADAKQGRSFDRPIFCRTRGAAFDSETIAPARFLLADGEIAAHCGLREVFDFRILVITDWSLQWQARMGRDRSERATSLRKAITLFLLSNLRDYPRFSAGASSEAHLVLRRDKSGALRIS